MLNYTDAQKKLSEYGQEHLLKYYDELSEEEKASLLSQIERIDFSVLESLEAEKNVTANRGTFAPLSAVTVEVIAAKRD